MGKRTIGVFSVITIILTILALNACERREDETNDFLLKISVEHSIMQQGENILVHVELENISKNDHKIAKYFLFYPQIYGESWIIDKVSPPWPTFENLERGGVIKQVINLDKYFDLPQGTYQLQVRAVFFLNWESLQGLAPGDIPENAKEINIFSNTITLIVQ
ncbi:MAG: hypothetical protein FWE36_03845 [Erysipelotrichales bacterium]|nr:hypothetical protein [Erysipelotrichales bacterium]